MKTHINSIIIVILFAGCCVVGASAQVHSQVKAAIPFDFTLQGRNFKAGNYVISSINPESDGRGLAFRQMDVKRGQIVILTPATVERSKNTAGPVLIFNRYGSKYFFSEMRNPSENFAARARRSKQEEKMAEKTGSPKREVVALARLSSK